MDITDKQTNGEIIDTWWLKTKVFLKSSLFQGFLKILVISLVIGFAVDRFNNRSTEPSADVKAIAKSISSRITAQMEKAYFEGQKDYLNGKVCIEATVDGNITHYKWIKSPWDSGTTPVFKIPSEKIK